MLALRLTKHEPIQDLGLDKRPPVHAVAPDLKISEDALAEFAADLEEARVTGAVAEQLEVPNLRVDHIYAQDPSTQS